MKILMWRRVVSGVRPRHRRHDKIRSSMANRAKRTTPKISGPFLRHISALADHVDPSRYPFNISAFSHGIDIEITSNVTFFVGENGSGKSTLFEAIARNSGFGAEGGSRDHQFARHRDRSDLASALRLSWLPKVTDGFFMRTCAQVGITAA